MNEPDAGYPATLMASVARRLDQPSPPAPQEQSSDPQFNVLLVSPMPASIARDSGGNGQGSRGQQATETIKVLESLNIQVELDYLRPPTWESLSRVMEERSGHYHLVHFDGITIAPGTTGDSVPALMFEDEQYQADPVPVSQVAELLISAGVPLVLLAAGQQPNTGHAPHLWPAAGLVLAQAGLPQAAILPHALHGADTTEQFLLEMYQSLTQGSDLGTSLARARRGLMDDPHPADIDGEESILGLDYSSIL